MFRRKAFPYYHNVREALEQPGCPFCRLLDREADKLVEAVLWEAVNDVRTREEFNHARGYCQRHSWQLVRGGAALGISFLMQGLVKSLLDTLATYQTKEPVFSLRRLLPAQADQAQTQLVAGLSPHSECPICRQLQVLEDHYAQTLIEHLEGPQSLLDSYLQSAGACLPHLRTTISKTSTRKALAILLEAQQTIWRRLHGELSEFIRKKDYRYVGEPFGSEEDAWLRAIEAMAGAAPPEVGDRKGLTQAK